MEYALLFSLMGTWILWLHWRYAGLHQEHMRAVKIIGMFVAEKIEAEGGDILEFEIKRKSSSRT